MEICEPGMQGICPSSDICERVHHDKPYIWEIQPEGAPDWLRFNDAQQQFVEQQFADPAQDGTYVKIMMTQADGSSLEMDVAIDFNHFVANACYQGGSQPQMMQVRRISTNSYGAGYLARARGEDHAANADNTFHTLWIWYYHHGNAWLKFGEDGHSPLQSIIETKYLAKQEVFRFVVPPEPAKDGQTFLLNFSQHQFLHVQSQQSTPVRRRPEFMSHEQIVNKKWLTFPPWKNPTYLATLPVNWFPINPACEFELIPLNPDSMEFHLIASEFVQTMKGKVIDVFRVQNPFLWNKYKAKKDYLTDRLGDPNELQLFHGTSDEGAVQAILRQNFDWRICGKNATLYGHGSYFARDASFSDRYSSNSTAPFRWMFMARILVGRFVRGHKDYNRPPAIDPGNRFGDIYDSCVDDMNNPTKYVIFENDQCYPEYLFSYSAA